MVSIEKEVQFRGAPRDPETSSGMLSPEAGAKPELALPHSYIQTGAATSKYVGSHHHAQKNLDGAFEGSFGGSSRTLTEVSPKPWYRRREYFTDGWTDQRIWRAAVVECFATALMTFLTGQFGATVMSLGTKQIAAYVGIWNAVLLAVFIYATAPASGGHLNPIITLATTLCGLCPPSRGVLYMVFQTLGGALGGGLLRGSWGHEKALAVMGGGCFFDPAFKTPGQVFVTEMMCTLCVIYLSFGTGLDPRQAILFGPQLGPILVGLSLGIVISATSGTAEGYAGANMNPARCLALSVARGEYSYHWIWWIAPGVGGLLNVIMYNLIPPYHAEKCTKNCTKQESPPAS